MCIGLHCVQVVKFVVFSNENRWLNCHLFKKKIIRAQLIRIKHKNVHTSTSIASFKLKSRELASGPEISFSSTSGKMLVPK